ncbi:hypothetical protein AM1_4587 [Acaryochloris marina MBIC11017]|uniref:Uncharacterized protein n=1 Tax=Acaryochloris marina (strain MBIC 11017) TaxID=329726 RepID=B0BZB7_ACAM1|nr:hypothetical protein AM1_4587 [Acaryochloris marina MBIC11017]
MSWSNLAPGMNQIPHCKQTGYEIRFATKPYPISSLQAAGNQPLHN